MFKESRGLSLNIRTLLVATSKLRAFILEKPKSLARSKNKYKSFFIFSRSKMQYCALVVSSLILSLFSQCSFATPYYWAAQVTAYMPDVVGNSPDEACNALMSAFAKLWEGGYTVEKVGLKKFDETTYGCFFIPRSIKGGLDGALLNRAIYRRGDECRIYHSYDTDTGVCTYTPYNTQKGTPPNNLSCPANTAGNPINFAIGNKFQQETDYRGVGAFPLRFSRAYNSLDGQWRHSYSTRLRLGVNSITLVMADGRESYFTLQGGTAKAEVIELGQLTQVAGMWIYTAANNERFTFDAQGRLTQWGKPSGAEQHLVYASGLVTVTDNLGQSLEFTEDTLHQPLSLTVGGTKVVYKYDVNNQLIQITRTGNGQAEVVRFHYEDLRNYKLLTGITDARGVRYATWTYDAYGRPISSEHAGGAERTLVSYNSIVTVTNALGKQTNYQFQIIQGVKRITAIQGEPSANCPNSNSTFTYDARGLLKTKTDNKGHLTTYDYNSRGLEVSRTEAAGTAQARTISTDWHATFNLPVKVSEPGRITTYTYDAQGRQLSQTRTAL